MSMWKFAETDHADRSTIFLITRTYISLILQSPTEVRHPDRDFLGSSSNTQVECILPSAHGKWISYRIDSAPLHAYTIKETFVEHAHHISPHASPTLDRVHLVPNTPPPNTPHLPQQPIPDPSANRPSPPSHSKSLLPNNKPPLPLPDL